MKRRCKYCSSWFEIKKEAIYTVQERLSPSQLLSKVPDLYDATDCTHCGCQYIIAPRMPKAGGVRDEADE